MDANSAIALLRALGATQISSGSNWVRSSCPLAFLTHQSGHDTHPSFAIKCADDKESYYNCFTCGSGDLQSLVYQIYKARKGDPKCNFELAMKIAAEDTEHDLSLSIKPWGAGQAAEPMVEFSEDWLESFPVAHRVKRANQYLQSRGLNRSMMVFADIRYDTSLDAVAFPIRDFQGVLRGLRARKLKPSKDEGPYHIYRTKEGKQNPLVWYGEWYLNFALPVVVVESLFDVMSILRVYGNVCAPMSAGFSEQKARRLRAATRIISFFDEDKAGYKARERLRKALPFTPITNVYCPSAMDPGDLSGSEISKLIAKYVRLGGMIDHG